MATDLQPLLILLGQHEKQRDLAIVEHQRSLNASEAARLQATQLRDYRGEYEQRWSAQFSRSMKLW